MINIKYWKETVLSIADESNSYYLRAACVALNKAESKLLEFKQKMASAYEKPFRHLLQNSFNLCSLYTLCNTWHVNYENKLRYFYQACNFSKN